MLISRFNLVYHVNSQCAFLAGELNRIGLQTDIRSDLFDALTHSITHSINCYCIAKINKHTKRSLRIVENEIVEGKVESTIMDGKISLVKVEKASMFEDWNIVLL